MFVTSIALKIFRGLSYQWITILTNWNIPKLELISTRQKAIIKNKSSWQKAKVHQIKLIDEFRTDHVPTKLSSLRILMPLLRSKLYGHLAGNPVTTTTHDKKKPPQTGSQHSLGSLLSLALRWWLSISNRLQNIVKVRNPVTINVYIIIMRAVIKLTAGVKLL